MEMHKRFSSKAGTFLGTNKIIFFDVLKGEATMKNDKMLVKIILIPSYKLSSFQKVLHPWNYYELPRLPFKSQLSFLQRFFKW